GDSDGDVTDTDERLYVNHDANFNTTALVGYNSGASAWQVRERYLYDPYGRATTLTGTWGSRVGTLYEWRYRHQGGRYDGTGGSTLGGTYAFRNRDLNVLWSAWMEQDPMGYIDSLSLYANESSNPCNANDPMGLYEQDFHYSVIRYLLRAKC